MPTIGLRCLGNWFIDAAIASLADSIHSLDENIGCQKDTAKAFAELIRRRAGPSARTEPQNCVIIEHGMDLSATLAELRPANVDSGRNQFFANPLGDALSIRCVAVNA